MRGVFCANFASPRSGWDPCKVVWCGSCYAKPTNVTFYRATPQDESGFQWTRPKDQLRHECARDGDHLITPFQCDLCVFRNLTQQNPSSRDHFLLDCIRQANLDAFWGRETATVASTRRAVTHTVTALAQVRVPPPFPPLGPFPVEDLMGYSMAIGMLIKSREPGQYANYQQFESIRKLRASFSNVFLTSMSGTTSLCSMGGTKPSSSSPIAPHTRIGSRNFPKGCLSHMGQVVKQDMAVSLELMLALVEMLEKEWEQATTSHLRSAIASVGAYVTVAFCGSFRGPEVFLADLYGLNKYLLQTSQ
jgi:hypothetical protein